MNDVLNTWKGIQAIVTRFRRRKGLDVEPNKNYFVGNNDLADFRELKELCGVLLNGTQMVSVANQIYGTPSILPGDLVTTKQYWTTVLDLFDRLRRINYMD